MLRYREICEYWLRILNNSCGEGLSLYIWFYGINLIIVDFFLDKKDGFWIFFVKESWFVFLFDYSYYFNFFW